VSFSETKPHKRKNWSCAHSATSAHYQQKLSTAHTHSFNLFRSTKQYLHEIFNSTLGRLHGALGGANIQRIVCWENKKANFPQVK
jgi:hypothetical protein